MDAAVQSHSAAASTQITKRVGGRVRSEGAADGSDMLSNVPSSEGQPRRIDVGARVLLPVPRDASAQPRGALSLDGDALSGIQGDTIVRTDRRWWRRTSC